MTTQINRDMPAPHNMQESEWLKAHEKMKMEQTVLVENHKRFPDILQKHSTGSEFQNPTDYELKTGVSDGTPRQLKQKIIAEKIKKSIFSY